MITRRQWRKVVDTNRRYLKCQRTGGHVDSGVRSEAILGGQPYTMATCAKCGVRYEAPAVKS